MTERSKDRIETPQLTLVKATIALLESEEAVFEARQKLEPVPLGDWMQSTLFQEYLAAQNRFEELLGGQAESSWDWLSDVDTSEPWPNPPHDFDSRDLAMLYLRSYPESRWGMRYVLFKRPLCNYEKALFIGTAGFKRPPSSNGTVEIGYWIADRYRAVDLAAEAVGALVTHALEDPSVQRVMARTSARHVPTIRVLGKNGFRRVGATDGSGSLLFQREREATP